MIYLDSAATAFPKPREGLSRALDRYLAIGVSPGRGGYDQAVLAEAEVAAIRDRVARFFGAPAGAHVAFAANATDALNMLIIGLAQPGSHVISSRLEHNSVLRPLHHLAQKGLISLDLLPFDRCGAIDPDQLAATIQAKTSLVVLGHGSNVLGTIQPIAACGAICQLRGVPLVIDAAQTAGCVAIDMARWGVQGLAFTGHKSLLGPSGIGGLVLGPDLHPLPTRFGGTGSDSENLAQPLAYPHRLEAGTINLHGILGLDEGIAHREAHLEDDYQREMGLIRRLAAGLRALPRLRLLADEAWRNRLPLLSCTLAGMSSIDAAAILDGDFDIAVRAGLHCAPLVHADLGTSPAGALRFSLGPFSTDDDISACLEAMAAVAGLAA